MNDLMAEIGHPTVIPFSVIAARILLAALLGALIGFEREWQNHSAGLRTHIMVCVAAATFGILTVEIALSPQLQGEAFQFDPIRAVEAVTAGVAFLAAGLIWAGRGKVHGLTTGAGMWLAGATGLASGLGLWQIAILSAVTAVLVMGVVHQISRRIGSSGDEPEDSPITGSKTPPPGQDRSKPR